MPLLPPTVNGFYQATSLLPNADTLYLLPPNFDYNKDISVKLYNVYTKNIVLGNIACTIKALPISTNPSDRINTVFSLNWLAGAGQSIPQNGSQEVTFIAEVTVKGDIVWKTDKNARLLVKTSLAVFYEQLENLELNGKFLVSGGAFAVIQRVADALPLTYKETLSLRYGLSPADRYVDLQAGMRLKIEFSANQFVAPGSELNGYVGTGVNYYEVCRSTDLYGNQRLTFNAFLAGISSTNIAQNNSNGTITASNNLDLQSTGTSRRYWRLFYPSQFPASTTANTGITQNVTLIGADSLSDLNKATNSYITSGQTIETSIPIMYIFFRGRTVVTPEILININGEPSYIAIGTTVRNLLDRFFNWPFPIRNGISNATGSLQYRRIWIDKQTENIAYNNVQFGLLLKDTSPTSLDTYELPVIKGDSLGFAIQLQPK